MKLWVSTGALNAALFALKTQKTHWVVTNKRYYPLLPKIINMADMLMIDKDKKKELCSAGNGCKDNNFISLIDSPSAPEGLVCPFESVDIFDAAYASRVYTKGSSHIPPKWKIMCGSLSKSSGLSGLRIGWASTDDDQLANSLSNYITTSYAGISYPSQEIAESILSYLDHKKFEILGARYLNDNREEVQKVLTKLGQGEVPSRGMFAIIQLGRAERKALERANIKYQSGETWGEDNNWARLSLGQTREIIRAAVKAILK